jgi:hypothetical protein
MAGFCKHRWWSKCGEDDRTATMVSGGWILIILVLWRKLKSVGVDGKLQSRFRP